MSGTNQGGRAIAAISILDRSPSRRLDRAQQILGVQDADDVLGAIRATAGAACTGAASTALDDLLGRIVGIDGDHLGAVDHHVGDFEVAEAEHIVDVLGLADRHLAVLGGRLDQSLDLDVGEDFVLRGFLDAERLAGSSAMTC